MHSLWAKLLAVGSLLIIVGAPGAAGAIGLPTPLASGGSSADPSVTQAVAQWVTNGGADNLKKLAADFTDLETAANSNDLGAISTSCGQLRTDVEGAQAYDPIPDAQAQHDWSLALAQYERGATDCVAGADEADESLITKASTEIVAGTNELDLVTARLGAISGT
jgi:hypothetical protein